MAKKIKKPIQINIILIVLPLVVGLVLGVLWRGLAGPSQDDNQNYARLNQPFPAMSLTLLDSGKEITSDEFRGNSAMVINVFASWCGPCVAEMPMLKKLKPQLANLQVKLVGINWQDKKSAAELFLKTNGNPFDILLADSDGRAMINMGLVGVPETYFIDKNGIVRFRKIGPIIDDKDMAGLLDVIKKWQ
ncbi:MAG: redoxin family protein [Hydrotalea sp.]|nr:redoxin family protein [Hydrotalea sp.]